MKVSDARLTPAFTNEECSDCGNETASVRIASTRLAGYAIFKPLATATAVTRYENHPAKTERKSHEGTREYSWTRSMTPKMTDP
jgi:hypothetical protein